MFPPKRNDRKIAMGKQISIFLMFFVYLFDSGRSSVDAVSTKRATFVSTTSSKLRWLSHSRKQNHKCKALFFYCQEHPKSLAIRHLSMTKSSFMDRIHGESEDAYFKRILAAASDTKSFGNAVIQQQPSSFINAANSTEGSELSSNNRTRKGGYVRAEDWDAEEQRKAKSGSWEDRVQFDGQQYGNRVNQNEILRHHLKGF
jgi:hypothetical protein